MNGSRLALTVLAVQTMLGSHGVHAWGQGQPQPQQTNAPVNYRPGPGDPGIVPMQPQQPGGGMMYNHGAADDLERRMPINADIYGTYGGGSTGFADTKVQGQSRSTWSSISGRGQGDLVTLETEGRPLFGEVKVWEGPDNTPLKFRVYSEDGRARPFQALVQPSPQSGTSQTLSVQNAGPLEFPMAAGVQKTMPMVPRIPGGPPGSHGGPRVRTPTASEYGSYYSGLRPKSYYSDGSNGNYLSTVTRGNYMNKRNGSTPPIGAHPDSQTINIDGGALRTVSVNGQTPRVKITISSEGLPLSAMLEVWEGPGHARQVAEVESQDGLNRPFSCAIDTYGYGATICVRNLGAMTFPMSLTVEPMFD